MASDETASWKILTETKEKEWRISLESRLVILHFCNPLDATFNKKLLTQFLQQLKKIFEICKQFCKAVNITI